ncbi:MAG: hypothetical protein Q9196_001790 [Gyalolechia fulgens]
MAGDGIRIAEGAFKGACGALFALSMIAAAARTLIRLRPVPRLALDDGLLLFACFCLVASTGLLFELIPKAYLSQRLNSGQLVSLPFPIASLPGETVLTTKILHAYTVLSWVVIYAAKFCFLTFFRALIDRVRRMIIYWKIVIVITFLLGALSMCETFIACPHLDESSASCLQDSGFQRTLVVGVVAKCLDILTDVLLISIPISLLWNVRIKTRQKLGIGAFLCLSIVMIIIAIIKASGIRTSVDSFDLVWEVFWQQMEACAAVLMVSLTAFRSVFLSNKQRVDQRASPSNFLHRLLAVLFTKKSSGEDAKHLTATTPTDGSPPYLTLGAPFRSAQREGLWNPETGTISQGSATTRSHDLETGVREKDTESGSSGVGDGRTESTIATSLPLSESQSDLAAPPRSDLQSIEKADSGHWWQIGLISNFTPSQPTGTGHQS